MSKLIKAVQKSYNQVVLFGDSLFQQSSQVQDGFSFQGALQDCSSSSLPPTTQDLPDAELKDRLH